eukprot:g19392.t1
MGLAPTGGQASGGSDRRNEQTEAFRAKYHRNEQISLYYVWMWCEAFYHNEYNVFLEDDLHLSPIAGQYFSFVVEVMKRDHSVFGASSFNENQREVTMESRAMSVIDSIRRDGGEVGGFGEDGERQGIRSIGEAPTATGAAEEQRPFSPVKSQPNRPNNHEPQVQASGSASTINYAPRLYFMRTNHFLGLGWITDRQHLFEYVLPLFQPANLIEGWDYQMGYRLENFWFQARLNALCFWSTEKQNQKGLTDQKALTEPKAAAWSRTPMYAPPYVIWPNPGDFAAGRYDEVLLEGRYLN